MIKLKGHNPDNPYQRFTIIGIILVLLVLAYLIIKPFLVGLISAFIISYLIHPFYLRLRKILPKSISSFICVLSVTLIILLPLGFLITFLAKQIINIFTFTNFETYYQRISEIGLIEKFGLDVTKLLNYLGDLALTLAEYIIASIPSLIITLLITILGTFYLLQDWNNVIQKLKLLIPAKNKEEISAEISKSTKAIIYGYAIIALIEFIVAAIGFSIAGIKLSWLIASLIAIAAFLPGIGPGLIWIPTLIINFLVTGNYYSSITILITGLIISIGLDTLLAPKLIGDRAKASPLLILIGILGGVPLFGIFGIIIGPLVLIYIIKIIESLLEE